MYILDTNLYIQALQNAAFSLELETFQQAALPRLWVSAVVMFEVAVGAHDEAAAERYERWMLAPFRMRNRILVPTASTWLLASQMTRALRDMGGNATKLGQRSFLNDILIAASCREAGATLITANRADYALLQGVGGVRFMTSFPVL